jgi:predicted amidohydrolase YtcJ
MMSFARMKLSVDLVGTTSMEELVVRVEKYDQKKACNFIIGRGWDQSIWFSKELPTNELLSQKFPNKPVVLHRIDGHAALANDKALELAGIGPDTRIEGGEIKVVNGKCTGLLLDNAVTKVMQPIPDFQQRELVCALKEVQQELFQFGITGVHEAGVNAADFKLLRRICKSGELELNLYVMLFPTEENIQFAQTNGVLEEGNLVVRSFKLMGDGALGSRGAYLKQPYSDDHASHGILTTNASEIRRIAKLAQQTGYQLNIHAIGDATNRLVLEIVSEFTAHQKDHRWRLEHAQVIDPADFGLLATSGMIPSVQPTHAVSDQRWAIQRLGAQRMKGAYAYKSLLEQAGILAIGTDFPVELPNPYLTLHAAVNRTNAEGDPIGGFMPEEALTIEACLKGMTLGAAMAAFQENKLGTLEKGKDATFMILGAPLKVNRVFEPNFAHQVYILGKKVYSVE